MKIKQINNYSIIFYTKSGFMRICKFNKNFNNVEYAGLISDISEELASKLKDIDLKEFVNLYCVITKK